ncbi:MAG: GH32 C-terminal domain-containing protein [Planctomycetes bacterium]|nr:GH32 C-terminal domain-containing protein [Planctomycetota bacterium]
MKRALPLLALLCCSPLLAADDRAEILIADFEGDTYPEGWKTTGTAFGKGPARGTLPNQMAVSGFLGKGLVNSFTDGDASTGTLTSPAFQIDRKYLNFLIGGGKHSGKTCVNLIVGGKAVRSATGPNDKPGGSERLDWRSWDVAEFEGKGAIIEIVDDEKGGWGHINADHFVQADKKKQLELTTHEIVVDRRYLHLPVKTGAPMKRMKFIVNGKVVREFDIELVDGGDADFWTFADLSAFPHKTTLTIETTLVSGSNTLFALTQSGDLPDSKKLYQEKHRPLFHYTSRRGWLNDPNGLVYAPDPRGAQYPGEWHLYYQHNPYGVNWGNMHWGHATSKDLVHWKEEGIALYPKKYGDWAFSGSAAYDGGELVLAYTSTGRGECIATSKDGGRTLTESDKNPVVKHVGRDPKLVWHAKANHWVMAVYEEFEKKQWIAFYTSPDLKNWTFASRIEGFYECPDLFPMPVELAEASKLPTKEKWVLYGADARYIVGEFDGKEFKPDVKEKKQLWHGHFYAAQTFDNAPLIEAPLFSLIQPRRRVQIGWANGVTFPGMPFNQQMTVPVELSLHDEKDGSRLRARPVKALESLRAEQVASERPLLGAIWLTNPKTAQLRKVVAEDLDAFDVQATLIIRPVTAEAKPTVTFSLRGTELVYDVAKKTLTCKGVTASVPLRDGKLTLRILVDRGSVEVFADEGRVAMSIAAIPVEKNTKLELHAAGADLGVPELSVWRMPTSWAK